jgi:hypothetical protein
MQTLYFMLKRIHTQNGIALKMIMYTVMQMTSRLHMIEREESCLADEINLWNAERFLIPVRGEPAR